MPAGAGRAGLPRQDRHQSPGCAGGSVRPQPREDLQVLHPPGAAPLPHPALHHRAQGGLHPQVHPAQAGVQTPQEQVVPGHIFRTRARHSSE